MEEGVELAAQINRLISGQDERNDRGLRSPLVQVEGNGEAAGLRGRDLGLVGRAEVALDGR